jgi:hypothetical protein
MKKLSISIAIALTTTAGAAIAQSAMDKSGVDKAAKDGMVVVTGCVAQSADGKQYMLNDAIMAPLPAGKKPSTAATAGAAGDKTVLSYVLDGGDVKSHVGHKVEVTATNTVAKAGKTGASSDPSKMETSTMGMDHKDVGGTLKVRSLKMVAASCM